jgi:hypothetical protein
MVVLARRLSFTACLCANLAGACVGGDDGSDEAETAGDCVDPEVDSCQPLYAPTFANVYANTIMPTCAAAGTACHANPEALGARPNGLYFADPDQAHEVLLGAKEGALIRPGDPGCSEVIVRLGSDDPLVVMPPGATGLRAEERCSIAQWIDQGAPR